MMMMMMKMMMMMVKMMMMIMMIIMMMTLMMIMLIEDVYKDLNMLLWFSGNARLLDYCKAQTRTILRTVRL